jgi:hypothetical protein
MAVDDPILIHAASLAVGAILLAGAWDKLHDREVFAAVVEAYGLLPIPLVVVFSLLLAVAEAVIGSALWVPAARPWAHYAGIALLVVVTIAVAINLLRGRTDLDCGCGGAGADQALSWWLVMRNALLGAVLWAASAAPAARALNWADYVVVGFATLAGFGIYAAANQLLANAPRLAALRH